MVFLVVRLLVVVLFLVPLLEGSCGEFEVFADRCLSTITLGNGIYDAIWIEQDELQPPPNPSTAVLFDSNSSSNTGVWSNSSQKQLYILFDDHYVVSVIKITTSFTERNGSVSAMRAHFPAVASDFTLVTNTEIVDSQMVWTLYPNKSSSYRSFSIFATLFQMQDYQWHEIEIQIDVGSAFTTNQSSTWFRSWMRICLIIIAIVVSFQVVLVAIVRCCLRLMSKHLHRIELQAKKSFDIAIQRETRYHSQVELAPESLEKNDVEVCVDSRTEDIEQQTPFPFEGVLPEEFFIETPGNITDDEDLDSSRAEEKAEYLKETLQ